MGYKRIALAGALGGGPGTRDSNQPLSSGSMSFSANSRLPGLSTGSYILNELVSLKKTGRVSEIIVLGRSSASDAARSAEAAQKGVAYYPVTYTDESSVSAILKKHGIECVVSTLALSDVTAIKVSEPALVRAAAAAGVKRFLPSQYGTDISPEYDRRETREVNERKGAVIKEIERVGMEWSVIATCECTSSDLFENLADKMGCSGLLRDYIPTLVRI
jgi:hypothetical protein